MTMCWTFAVCRLRASPSCCAIGVRAGCAVKDEYVTSEQVFFCAAEGDVAVRLCGRLLYAVRQYQEDTRTYRDCTLMGIPHWSYSYIRVMAHALSVEPDNAQMSMFYQ